jgi:hypothetical protein
MMSEAKNTTGLWGANDDGVPTVAASGEPLARTIRNATYVLEILTRAYVPKGTPDYRELVAAIASLRSITAPTPTNLQVVARGS